MSLASLFLLSLPRNFKTKLIMAHYLVPEEGDTVQNRRLIQYSNNWRNK